MFFTTSSPDTVAADKVHRAQAVIVQGNANLKNSALAHLPSGVVAANGAWLVCAVMAFSLTCAAATTVDHGHTKATTATISRKLVSVPAWIAFSSRRIALDLPRHWPWEIGWVRLFTSINAPP